VSFRLRIFLLVLFVAGSAIGATAWLTLSLAAREVARAEDARDQHEAEIVDAIRAYGVTTGHWVGIDTVVADLSERTGLHIRVETRDGDVVTDSDHLEQRASGPVQRLPSTVEPVPDLDQDILVTARRAAISPEARLAQRQKDPVGRFEPPVPPRPQLPVNLFSPERADREPADRALIQAAQYRAALAAVRCMSRGGTGSSTLTLTRPPYLDEPRRLAEPDCATKGVTQVRNDLPWLSEAWSGLAACPYTGQGYDKCLLLGFQSAVQSPSVVPVQVYFGARQNQGLRSFSSRRRSVPPPCC
jgi:two-component system sensor histidine kinase BaeS